MLLFWAADCLSVCIGFQCPRVSEDAAVVTDFLLCRLEAEFRSIFALEMSEDPKPKIASLVSVIKVIFKDAVFFL